MLRPYQTGYGKLLIHHWRKIAGGTNICGISSQKIHMKHIGFGKIFFTIAQ